MSILLLVLVSPGCGKRAEPSGSESLPTARVRIQNVESKKHVATEEVVGTVRAKRHAAIEAKVSARVEQMLVAPGQAVKAGDLLAQLDAREIQARLDQSLAMREPPTIRMTACAAMMT